jgi:hypothetical protein
MPPFHQPLTTLPSHPLPYQLIDSVLILTTYGVLAGKLALLGAAWQGEDQGGCRSEYIGVAHWLAGWLAALRKGREEKIRKDRSVANR